MRLLVLLCCLLSAPVHAAQSIVSVVDMNGQAVEVITRPTLTQTGEATALALDMDLSAALAALPRVLDGVHKDEPCGERIALSASQARVSGGELLVAADVDYTMRVCTGSAEPQALRQPGRLTLALKPVAGADRVRLAGRIADLKLNGGLQGLEGLVKPALDAYLAHELAKAENAVTLPDNVQALKPRITTLKLSDSGGKAMLRVEGTVAGGGKEAEQALRGVLSPR